MLAEKAEDCRTEKTDKRGPDGGKLRVITGSSSFSSNFIQRADYITTLYYSYTLPEAKHLLLPPNTRYRQPRYTERYM
ncbi:hypothetical protein PAMA_010091 [Pampus argenteus]